LFGIAEAIRVERGLVFDAGIEDAAVLRRIGSMVFLGNDGLGTLGGLKKWIVRDGSFKPLHSLFQ